MQIVQLVCSAAYANMLSWESDLYILFLRFIPYFVIISYTVNTSICGKGQLDIAN